MSQGLANLEEIIESCRRIARGMKQVEGDLLSGELQAVEGMAGQLDGLKDKFFMKTVAAVPATKKCLEQAEKVYQELDRCKQNPEDDSVGVLKRALSGLADAVEELADKAEMRGTTLT